MKLLTRYSAFRNRYVGILVNNESHTQRDKKPALTNGAMSTFLSINGWWIYVGRKNGICPIVPFNHLPESLSAEEAAPGGE